MRAWQREKVCASPSPDACQRARACAHTVTYLSDTRLCVYLKLIKITTDYAFCFMEKEAVN